MVSVGTRTRSAGKAEPAPSLSVGSSHWVFNRSQIPHMADIIETRTVSGTKQVEYYIHYRNYDKRLDEWVGAGRFLTEKQIKNLGQSGTLPADRSLSPHRHPHGGGDGGSAAGVAAGGARSTRRRQVAARQAPTAALDPAYEELEREHEEATKVKNIQKIEIGCYQIDCWYFSPYPAEYSRPCDLLYICEKCLKYMKAADTYRQHYHQCQYSGPPGKLIYLKDGLAVFELDGERAKLYCQNLCLLAKLFLDHKTLYYDVSPFMFYVLCEVNDDGVRLVGYYSKEKDSVDHYNLACIMILPPHQRKGYGRFLIQLSYEITVREGKTGSPEKPLSDLGRLSYKSFWSYELLVRLKRAWSSRSPPSIACLAAETGFKEEDVIETLTELGLLKTYRGQHMLNLSSKLIESHLRDHRGKTFTKLDPECLSWP